MENKILKKQRNRINNSRPKFERINDIELSIIFGLSVSFGWWLIDKEDVLNAKALSATFFIATYLVTTLIATLIATVITTLIAIFITTLVTT